MDINRATLCMGEVWWVVEEMEEMGTERHVPAH